MKVFQIILLAYFGVMLLLFARDHGKPRKGNDSFWSGALAVGILFVLIYFGGGFSLIFK